jgi:predicted Zn-dependent peptidase
MKTQQKYYSYQNGSQLLTLQDKTFKSMIIFFYVKIGSKHESPKINGISHFLEHMLFKGTEKYPNHQDINKTLDSKGIDFNAFTDKNITGYYFKFLPDENTMKLVCDMVYQMLFKSHNRNKDLQVERNVVIQEYNQMIDTPDDYVNEIIEKFVFEGHPLGMSVIGTKKTINTISKKDIDQFYQSNYKHSNMFISMVGNFPHHFKNIIEKLFIKSEPKKKILTNPTIKIHPFTAAIKKSPLKYVRRNLQQNFLSLLFPIRGLYDSRLNQYRIIANILGGNMSSRLFVRIREELGLAYGISCDMSNYEEAGYFEIHTKTEPENTVKCLKNILIELQKFMDKKISDRELENNQKNYCDIFKTGFDDLENVAEFYNEQYLFNTEKEDMKSHIKKINKLTTQDIKKIATDLFDFKKMMVVCYGECQEKKLLDVIQSVISK